MATTKGASGGSVRGREYQIVEQSVRAAKLVQEFDHLIDSVVAMEASLRDTRAEVASRREEISRMLEEVDGWEQDVHGRVAMQAVTSE